MEDNLHFGRIRLVFVAAIIPPELRRVIEFLKVRGRRAVVGARRRLVSGGMICRMQVCSLWSNERSSWGAA